MFVVKALARNPKIQFNVSRLNYGPIFVIKNPLKKILNLEVINFEEKAMTIETLFVKKPYLDVQLSPGEVLLPNKPKNDPKHNSKKRYQKEQSGKRRSRSKALVLPKINTVSNRNLVKKNMLLKNVVLEKLIIPIVFSPREVKKYREKITFVVNGYHELSIYITGEGCRFLLELESPEDSSIDFGSVLVGREILRRFSLKNNSKTKISLDFDVKEQLKNLKEMGISLLANSCFHMKPKEVMNFTLKFQPLKRLTSLKTDLIYKFAEDDREVFKAVELLGSSQGFEIKIVEDTLSFGEVVMGSSLVKTLEVCNIGDITANYRWDMGSNNKNFSIQPLKGVLNASEEFSFLVKFHPKELYDSLIKPKLLIDGFPQATPTVTLVGTGVKTESLSIKEILFETNTRTISMQDILITVCLHLIIFYLNIHIFVLFFLINFA